MSPDGDAREVAATLEQVIRDRHSIRGFRPEPVAQDVLDHIFSVAQWAPSNCNVQPWRVYVATGAARDRIKEALVAEVMSGAPSAPEFDRGGKFEGVYRKHQVECAVALYSEMGVERDDKEARMKAALRNFELFDAPHVAFIGMLKSFGPTVALDVGIYIQTLMLMMTAHGIACCPQGALRQYPAVVHELMQVPDDIGLLCGISFGYADGDVPANRTRTTRAPIADNVSFRS